MSPFREMAFVLTISAANADATPAQRATLRLRVKPLLDRYRVDGNHDPILAVLRDVMGPGWQPSGEWAEAIQAFQ